MTRKPPISSIKHWILDEEMSNEYAKVHYGIPDTDFFRVTPTSKEYKMKYFYGETAWMDSRRYAGDIYSKEIYK